MRQQLTNDAISILIAVLLVFWVSIAAIVRHHGRRRASSRAGRGATETRG